MDKWLSHPTALKITSIVLAILLWAVVHFDSESPNTVASLIDTKVMEAVTIQTRGMDENLHDLRVLEPTVVRIMVRGNKADLIAAEEKEYKVYVDLTDIPDGQHILPLEVEHPKRIQVIQLSPAKVTVELEPVTSNDFNVAVNTTGTPGHSYKVGTPIINPGIVNVTLPNDMMEQVGSVIAEVNVNGKEDSFVEKKAQLAVYSKAGEEMTNAVIDPPTVEVEVPIIKPSVKLPLQLAMTGKLADGLSLVSVTPEVNQITVYGPQAELDKLTVFDDVSLNLSSIKQSGVITLDLSPPGKLAAVEPSKLNVKVEVAPFEVRTIPQVPVSLTGLQEGLEAVFTTPESGRLDLQVTGAPSVLAGLAAGDIELIANLEGLKPGTRKVKVQAVLPHYVEATAPEQLEVTVEITESEQVFVPGDGAAGEEPGEGETDPPVTPNVPDTGSGSGNGEGGTGETDSPDNSGNSGNGNSGGNEGSGGENSGDEGNSGTGNAGNGGNSGNTGTKGNTGSKSDPGNIDNTSSPGNSGNSGNSGNDNNETAENGGTGTIVDSTEPPADNSEAPGTNRGGNNTNAAGDPSGLPVNPMNRKKLAVHVVNHHVNIV
ncbi:hypothetical protein EBB07_15300 [Paenibacillaceae bacterium]|nr:hypothetical protein EBB07_15300 [Paenibacillaceae bacterium]